MRISHFITTLALSILLTGTAYAASIRVDFDMPYKKGFFKKEPNDKFRAQAMERALSEIWKKYQARLDSTKLSDIEKSREQIESRIPDFISDLKILEEKVDTKALIVSYSVRGNVNDTLVSTIISELSGDSAASGDGSSFAFLFVARRQGSVTEFEAEISRRAKARGAVQKKTLKTTEDTVSESEEGDGTVEMEAESQGEEVNVGAEIESSGSVTRKADEASWIPIESKGVDAEVNKVLTEAGYEVTPADDLLECADSDYTSEDLVTDIMSQSNFRFSKEARGVISDAIKECEVQFFALGYMDVDSIMQDEQSGGWQARVSVNVTVKYYKRRLPKTVATVQESVRQTGVTQDEARDKALREAGRAAAAIIASQMRSKGLQ